MHNQEYQKTCEANRAEVNGCYSDPNLGNTPVSTGYTKDLPKKGSKRMVSIHEIENGFLVGFHHNRSSEPFKNFVACNLEDAARILRENFNL